jgi:hypothetical protein
MASKYAAAAGRKNSPIDLPLAAAAALAVGFAAFVVPEGILTRLVEASGLPSILSAAQPPLGTTARAAVAAAAAVGAFGAVFVLLRLLGGKAAPERERESARDAIFRVDEIDEPDAAAPRLRRADVHPDAPARRPILAARELGEPEREPAPAPIAPVQEVAPEPEPTDEMPELDELELSGPDIEMLVAEPVEEPSPAETVEAPPKPLAEASIAELMARLERGLARRFEHKSGVERSAPIREPQPQAPRPPLPGHGDDRLRSAMENLQKMAARAG